MASSRVMGSSPSCVLVLMLLVCSVAVDALKLEPYIPSLFSGSGVTRPLLKGQKPPKGGDKKAKEEYMREIVCSDELKNKAAAVDQCFGTGKDWVRECPGNTAHEADFDTTSVLTGGPTGCTEAWATVVADDVYLPGALVLVHTLRRHSTNARDIIVIASSRVSKATLDALAKECVIVIVSDPSSNAQATDLAAVNARYQSGYWLLKMLVWRLREYSRVVYLDADIYVRQDADALFCTDISPTTPISVTPRSATEAASGFNAGMFVFAPSNIEFRAILTSFEALSESELAATTEQDFLNKHFKGRYSVVPLDFIMKHRRMVRTPEAWDLARVKGYHMNGAPKPWNPTWRTACAYPGGHGKRVRDYEAFFVEWWYYYYDMLGEVLPLDTAQFKLRPEHDPTRSWETWNEDEFVRTRCQGSADERRRR